MTHPHHPPGIHHAAAATAPQATADKTPLPIVIERVAYALFGPLARRLLPLHPRLRTALANAFIPKLPESFLSLALLGTATVLAGGLLLCIGAFYAIPLALGFRVPHAGTLTLVTPTGAAILSYAAFLLYPGERADRHRRDLDTRLPYAANYAAAMETAGVVPARVIADLARQRVYGAVAREMAWIHRDVSLLGLNVATALQRAVHRTPSARMKDFLDGARSTILTGGNLRSYFAAKAEQYMADNRRHQKEFVERLGLIAESYVTVVIAGPLFLLVMMSVMLIVSSSSPRTTYLFLYLLVFLALPVSHLAFAYVIQSSTPEA